MHNIRPAMQYNDLQIHDAAIVIYFDDVKVAHVDHVLNSCDNFLHTVNGHRIDWSNCVDNNWEKKQMNLNISKQ